MKSLSKMSTAAAAVIYAASAAFLSMAVRSDVAMSAGDPGFAQAGRGPGFTPGNLVVLRVGDGTASLTGAAAAAFLDEYTASGSLVQSVPMPIADSGPHQTLTVQGSSVNDGMIGLSADGRYIIVPGYDAVPGTSSPAGSASSAVHRVIGRVDMSGGVDTTTVLSGTVTGNIRAAAGSDGTAFWTAGSAGGIYHTPFGMTNPSPVLVSSTVTNNRWVAVAGGRLFASGASGAVSRLGTVGSGLPAAAGQTVSSLNGLPVTAAVNQFFFADLSAAVEGADTLYFADDGTSPGIYKYSLVSGGWVPNGSVQFSTGTSAQVRGLAGLVSGPTVTVFAAGSSGLGSFTDTSGHNGPMAGTAALLTVPGANRAFRGLVALPSMPETSLTSAPPVNTRSTSASFEFVSTAPSGGYDCRLDAGGFESCSSPKVYAGLAPGVHNFSVRARDSAGNPDPTPASHSWRIDTSLPSIPPWNRLMNTGSSAARTFRVAVNDDVGVSDVAVVSAIHPQPGASTARSNGGAAVSTCARADAANYDCTVPGAPVGSSVVYHLTARDLAGNVAESPPSSAPHVYNIGSVGVPAGTFTEVELDSGDTVVGEVEVLGRLTLSAPVAAGPSGRLILGCAATVELSGSSAYFAGELEKRFCGSGSFGFPVGGSAYAPADAEVVTETGASIAVSTADSALPGSFGPGSLARNWRTVSRGAMTATLTFNYRDSDVRGVERNYGLLRRSGGVTGSVPGAAVDTVGNSIKAVVGDGESGWSAGVLGPTSAKADIGGRVSDRHGRGLRGVKVVLEGGDLAGPVTASTNQFGRYGFRNLSVGETFVVRVVAGRYRFTEAIKTVTLLDSVTDWDFMADPR